MSLHTTWHFFTYYVIMKTINGSTRTVYLTDNKALKVPLKWNEEAGTMANLREYEYSLRFPRFAAQCLEHLYWVLLMQERIQPLISHPKFTFFNKFREKCIFNKWRLSCNSFIDDFEEFNKKEFDYFFQWMWVGFIFEQMWIIDALRSFNPNIRHNMLRDKNYWIDKDWKIVLLDLGVHNLDLVLGAYGKDIFNILNYNLKSYQ